MCYSDRFLDVNNKLLLQEDKQFLQTLFAQIVDDEVDDDKRRDLVLFLKEFCIFSQPLQPNSKDTFFKTLTSLGVMGALEIVLVSGFQRSCSLKFQ